ncbi:putative zinc cadmium resistance protein [Rosellinia necatrix]|uniref:Putative zinc cadmium resistance protein n=1 Tax=Rosellinia necatrix TaxID=77044 RepID=A0A1W2TKA9_ROSNE|nr:putative zinc cadmium resistance protein [Rosellinia necatrix]
MAWSKTTRISIMLAIDIVFFLVELISGFMVHSLALMADAFHMLNDIISLIIGLWAVTVAKRATTNRFSYGWVRAEILGAFFNAVFLIALCISIILEALTRFVEPQEVTNPKLILIVGCFGLASNLVGFVVLGGHGHDHGHSHGDHGHEHVHQHGDVVAAEEGRADATNAPLGVNNATGDVRPGEHGSDTTRHIQYDGSSSGGNPDSSRNALGNWERRRASSLKRSRFTNIDELNIHPASFRRDIIDRSSHGDSETDESSVEDNATVETAIRDGSLANENTPLLAKSCGKDEISKDKHTRQTVGRNRRDSGVHDDHHHTKPASKSKKGHSHGHSHADMGMNAMVLHVIGDALGNVGVIATALIIWLTDWPGRFYADPAVSLFITLIILKSAIPLTKATSKVLLQATPDHLDLEDIREDIQRLPGVISCHHVHIWQLSDTKVVASLHVQIAFPITDEGGEKYMKLAKQARKCLHAYGIHSATIQPEFCLDQSCSHREEGSVSLDGQHSPLQNATKIEPGDGCLLSCVDDCVDQGCCTLPSGPGSKAGSSRRSSHSTAHNHEHGDGHDHSHDHNGHSHPNM